MVRVYNTLERSVVDLQPSKEGRVSMYVCGPTVYNQIHIGNARTMLWFDFIRRYLQYRGYEVTYVQNYTDVDDKIIERANLEGIAPEAVANKYERAYEDVMSTLGVQMPDVLVRATQHIDEMVKAIEGLIERGVAYESGGDVWFEVESFEGYGKLSGRTLDDIRAGEERIEPSPNKRSPLDFALWKAAKEGEPAWPSPWGPGRPGWHIECSVMSTKYLGMGFDIHGGGSDLTFPHHENEIAQAEALAGSEPFARNWLHAGMVQMDAVKMSKSLGNFVLAAEIAEHFDPGAVRYWALMASYRTQVVFSQSALEDATQAYGRWTTFLEAAKHALEDEMPQDVPRRRPVEGEGDAPPSFVTRAIQALDDDFNSAAAFASIHDLVREGNRSVDGAQRGEPEARKTLAGLVEQFLELTSMLGFSFAASGASDAIAGSLVEYLLELREDARNEKAFDRADAIRDRLIAIGVAVQDTPAGPRWRIAGRA